MCKLAVQNFGRFIVRAGSIDFRNETAKSFSLTIGNNERFPLGLSAVKIDPLKSASVDSCHSPTLHVLAIRTFSKVLSTIVQSIVIFMINLLGKRCTAKNFSMHGNHLDPKSIVVRFGVKTFSFRIPCGMPIPIKQPLVINGVNDTIQVARQRNKADTFVGRLNDLVSGYTLFWHVLPRRRICYSRHIITLLVFFALPFIANAQGVRIGDEFPVTSALNTPGVVMTVPNASISFCAYPANAVPCTNKITTYTDLALGTPCATSTQIVLAGTTTCVANTDSRGNWGLNIPPGNYSFTITIPSGGSFGPFNVTAGNTTSINATNLVGPGSISGIFSGNHTESGTLTSTGQINCKNLEGMRCVDSTNTAGWAGSDFVAWINSAYANCPATGCDIYVAAGSYTSSSTTGVLINTNLKPARILCPTAGATVLNFTAATATGFTFNFSAGNYNSAGIIGCMLQGPGMATASKGLLVGGAQGASQMAFRDIKVQGFGIAQSFSDNAFATECDRCVFLGNGSGVSVLAGVVNTGESLHYTSTVIAGAGGTASVCLAITAPVNNLVFDGGSLDQCSWNITAGQIVIDNTHFENPQGVLTSPMFVNAGGRVVLSNADMQWDGVGAPTPSAAISCTAGVLILEGSSFFSPITTLSNIISDSGTCELHEFGTKLSSGFTNFISYTSSAQISAIGNIYGNSTINGTLVMNPFSMPENVLPSGAVGNEVCAAETASHTIKCSYNNDSFLSVPRVVSFGTAAMPTGALGAGACAAAVTVGATGVAATDTIDYAFTADPGATTGYSTGALHIYSYVTANNVNFRLCSSAALTPGAATINWRVIR